MFDRTVIMLPHKSIRRQGSHGERVKWRLAALGWRLKSRLRGLGAKAALPQPLEALALDAVGVG